MSDNIQTNTAGQLTPCLQQKIDKTRYLVEVQSHASCRKPRTFSTEQRERARQMMIANKMVNGD